MKISVKPGDVFVASVNVKRHSGGFYTVQISTPHSENVGTAFTFSTTRKARAIGVRLYSSSYNPSVVTLEAESNDEEEALLNGLFDVLDCYSRYSVTLIAIPASLLEESEEAGMWEPQGNVDYLTP